MIKAEPYDHKRRDSMMHIQSMLTVAAEKARTIWYRWLDRLYLPLDRRLVRRSRNLQLLPPAGYRTGGKFSYAEWAHVVGVFQTLLCLHLEKQVDNLILDVGCGTGLMGIAAEPFLGEAGKYVGLDVIRHYRQFWTQHYRSPRFEFIHFDAHNAAYAGDQERQRPAWPLPSDQFDMVTALSVWTHLNEADATFYFNEVARVLKPGGKALITFFLLDVTYQRGVSQRSAQSSRYHMSPQDRWIFDRPAYDSDAWFCPRWAGIPEVAIGVTRPGLERLLASAGLVLLTPYPGNWKEAPGVFFQDALVFQKPQL